MVGNVDARSRIGGPRRSGDKAGGRTPSKFSMRLCHHGSATFLAADSDRDIGVVQSIQHRQIAFTRNAKDMVYAMYAKLLHQYLPAGTRPACICLHACPYKVMSDERHHTWRSPSYWTPGKHLLQ